jgi:DinB superfamily
MTAVVRQSVQRSQWLTELAQLGQRIGELASSLDRQQLDWSPPEGGWGAGQLLEHLCLANDSYVDRIRTAMYHAHARLPTDDPAWRPSLLGGWLARSITPGTRKLPAPRIYQPAPVARPGVLEAFLHGQRTLVDLVDTASRFDLARSRTSSPVSRLIRLNLGDCFAIPIVHEQRHLQQLERICRHPAFPTRA